MMLGHGCFSWSAKKQTIISLSTAQAEYNAAAHAGKEILWLRQLHTEVGFPLTTPTPFHIDNTSAITIIGTFEVVSKCSKHFRLMDYWLCEECEAQTFMLMHISSAKNVANIFTKALKPDQHGLLAKGNASIAPGITVTMSPADPYLYLPQSTCAAIAAELPVVYQPDYGLYFWDTTDRRYSQIITSPAYLEFVFSKNSRNNANLTIKVPFSLLNLTLKAPLVEKPTSYFPCMGTTGTYALGRAFAQAAFIGVNWGLPAGNWFLAQAPGPNIPGSARPTTRATSTQATSASPGPGRFAPVRR